CPRRSSTTSPRAEGASPDGTTTRRPSISADGARAAPMDLLGVGVDSLHVSPDAELPVGNVAETDLTLEEVLRAERNSGQDAASEVGLAPAIEVEPIERDASSGVRPEIRLGLERVVQVEIACDHGGVPEADFGARHQRHARSHRFALEVETEEEIIRVDGE